MDALLVDDSSTMRLRMRRLLEGEPGVAVADHADPAAALLEAQMRAFDLVLVDFHMPDMTGIAFIRALRTIAHYAQVPVIMITSDVCDATRMAALEVGATDFLDKRTRGLELHTRLRNFVRLAGAVRRLSEQAARLDGAMEAALRHLHEREEEIIFRLSLAVEYRDNDTGDHTWRVASYSRLIAEALGLAPDACRRLYLAAPLHDVGKVAVPDGILLKPGKLDAEEFALVKTHATIGQRILGESESELIQLAAEIAGAHHEHWDGGGYPSGLAGRDIPLAARIVAVADVFDALTTRRPYKAALAFEDAFAAIEAESGRHFDPACVAAFTRCRAEIAAVYGGAGSAARLPSREPWTRVPALLREISALQGEPGSGRPEGSGFYSGA
ncbi:response regulator [Methylobacterium sp. NEAU 140]|uniref:HD-GYP domain-containing protein n=1 Tax=Methylobacterium sp. NEAU 140 TaxID=3064945 RepID=UPI002732ED14|nr:HD domain-containing phosphohydrolase [Methylobacterium sp. NEAU 140]MDP4023494.1 response regulator [Methylobacterium sp. NEAU 140]